jgi:excisionase family DNA binding protein
MENRDLKNSPERLLVSKKEAAQILGVSVRTLEYLIFGKCLCVRRIGKLVLIPYAMLKRFASTDTPSIEKPTPNKKVKTPLQEVQ